MDDEGRPERLWARLVYPLFQQRQLGMLEWRLGLVVIGVALLFAFLVFGPFIPRFLWDVVVMGTYSAIVWVIGLFAGGGSTETAAPVLTQVPDLLPSPSSSPMPSPSPSPLPR